MTTFDKDGFMDEWTHGIPRDAVADEFEKLHAEIAALKAAMPAAPVPKTGWAVVVDEDGLDRCIYTSTGFYGSENVYRPLFFPTRDDAEVLVRALGTGRAAELNRETLEEVCDG